MNKHGELEQTVSRRGLLRGSAVVSWAVLGAAALPGAAFARLRTGPTLAGPSDSAAPPPGLSFFGDAALDFNARFALGAAGYGAAEVGEVIAAINTGTPRAGACRRSSTRSRHSRTGSPPTPTTHGGPDTA